MTNEVKPNMIYEVFIHKIDSDLFSTDDRKSEVCRDINDSMRDRLADFKVTLSFQLTSIYDHTVYEALSKVVQNLLP